MEGSKHPATSWDLVEVKPDLEDIKSERVVKLPVPSWLMPVALAIGGAFFHSFSRRQTPIYGNQSKGFRTTIEAIFTSKPTTEVGKK